MTDLLIHNTHIVPIGPGEHPPPGPVDVLVEDGAVSAVGEGLHRPPGAEEVDAAGRWCIPGLWDQHVHLTQWLRASERLDLRDVRSPEETLGRVAAELAQHPDRPVLGFGHRAGSWSRAVTVAELDTVSGDTPVVLVSGDAHHGWVNSAAVAALGLSPRGTVLAENEWFDAYRRLDTIAQADTSPSAVRATLDSAASRGVVGFVDLEFGQPREVWAERWTQDCDRLHVRWGVYADGLDDVLASGLRTGDPLDDQPDGGARLTMGPLKIISDGSLNTHTAWCFEPYPDGTHGAPNLSADELCDLHARAHAGGLEIATHAIGDAAVTQALDAYAVTGAKGSIEHAQLVRHEDVRRLAELDIRASVQPAHLLDDRDVTEQIWPDQAERAFAFRWMLDEGVELALGSDAPVSPLDPWLAMASAVHRSADEREPWHAEQALSPAQALAASVDGQATVGAGSRGDLVLLDADPLAAHETSQDAARALRDMPVALTVVAGEVVHRRL